MKICWDNLDFIILTAHGFKNLRNNHIYQEYDSCACCGEPFLGDYGADTYCSLSCASTQGGINRYIGKRFGTLTAIKNIEKGVWLYKCDCGDEIVRKSSGVGKNSTCGTHHLKDLIGKKFGRLTVLECVGKRKEESSVYYWRCLCECGNEVEVRRHSLIKGSTLSCGCLQKERASESNKKPIEECYFKNGLVPFGSGKKLVEGVDPVREKLIGKLSVLETRCTYCGKWFTPHINNFYSRISCLAGRNEGESRLYCSESCKKACPTYMQKFWPKGHKPATSREVQPELRQMVLERDNWTCQYGSCGKTVENAELHCHHFEGININPIESADLDMCITFCKKHHKLVHKQRDCRYFELTCNYYLTINK